MAGSASISGLASGLDTATIISQLMQLEAIPQSRLKTRVGTEQSAITSLQGFNTKLSLLTSKAEALAKPAGWSPVVTTSSYDKVTVSSTGAATATSLRFTIQATATNHALSFTDTANLTDVVVPAGSTVRLDKLDGDTTDIAVGDGTLEGVVKAINASGEGVRATTVRISEGQYRLRVESTTTGVASDFDLSVVDSKGKATPLLGGELAAQTVVGRDATIQVGADTITSSTNTFAGILTGIDVTLAPDAEIGKVVDVRATTDTKKVSTGVKELVDQLNALLTDIDTATASDKKSGVLAGDSLLRSVRDDLVNTLYTSTGGSLADVGIQIDRYGKFTFDEADFTAAYNRDPVATAAVFASAATDTGFIDRLAKVADRASDSSSGTITAAIKGRQSSVDQLNKNIEAWDMRLELRRTTLTRQFTALETALGRMTSQSSWLAGQISSLPTNSS